MNYQQILTRAWHLLWGYRALWFFGLLLALTTSSLIPGPADNPSNGIQFEIDKSDFDIRSFDELRADWPEITEALDTAWREVTASEAWEAVVVAIVGVAAIVLIALIVAAFVRYTSETAVIRMVDHHEATGVKLSVGQGLRLGWSRPAWRLFLIDLVIRLPLALLFLVLFGLTLVPLALWLTGDIGAGIFGVVLTSVSFLAVVFLAVVVGALVTLLMQFMRRVCVLEDAGVWQSIGRGFSLVRHNLKDALIVGVIMIGIGIVFTFFFLAALIVLVPVDLLFVVLGGLISAVPGVIAGYVTSAFASGAVPYIVGSLIAVPLFALIVAIPFAFVGGWLHIFRSSTWTLTYRSMMGLESVPAKGKEVVGKDIAASAA